MGGKYQSHLLAVHAIGHATMAGDAVAKVLDIEGALETRGEETAKGRNEGGEGSEEEDVVLVWRIRNRSDVTTKLRRCYHQNAGVIEMKMIKDKPQ